MVEEVDEEADDDEADDGADDSQEADHAEVFEEEGLTEGVACREDDGGEDDREEDLIVEGDLALEALNKGGTTYLTKTAASRPIRMATVDSWRKGTF